MAVLQNWMVFGISLESWLYALITTCLIYLLLDVLTRSTVHLAKRRIALPPKAASRRINQVVVGMAPGSKRYLYFLFALLIGLQTLLLPATLELRLFQAGVIVVGIQALLWINRGINTWLEDLDISGINPDLRKRATTTTMVFLLRLAVMLTVVLTVLANLGVNITAFVASLGIGGIAIALALQTILSDLFASLSIGLDKPFEVGDFIIVDEVMLGTVEYIGVKTTRLRSLGGEQLVRSNTELLKSVIRNYKRMAERRIVFSFGIRYETPLAKVGQLGSVLGEIISAIDNTRFDRAHFVKFGASSLDFEVVYYVLSSDYNTYMDIQQRINLELMQACAQRGILFARPTSILHFGSEVRLASAEIEAVNKDAATLQDMPG